MNIVDTRFERLIGEKLGGAYRKRADEVASGVPVDKYREEVGYLRGLKEALEMVAKARAELMQDR